jgi:predicted nuclease of predicted toxin-antitoxin system
VPEAQKLGATDEEHIAFAHAEGRVIFTRDEDFLKLAATGTHHAGIVYAHQQTSIGDLIQGLMLIYQILEAEEMFDNIEYL